MPMAAAPAHQHAPTSRPAPRATARAGRMERSITRAINRIRHRRRLPRLLVDSRLSRVAAWHSFDMLANNFMSHSSSNGTPFYSRIRRAYPARAVGENLIAFRGSCSGRCVVRYWMSSAPHRAELLAARYRRIGIGRGSYRGRSAVTADFASSS